MTNDRPKKSKKERDKMGKNELEITAYRNAGYALAACLTGKEFDSITLVPGVVDKPDVTMEGGWVNLGLLLMELSFSAAGEIHTGATVRETWFDTDVALLEECPGDLGRRMMTMTEQFTQGFMHRQWSIVTEIAEALLTQHSLTYRQVRDIILDTVLTS